MAIRNTECRIVDTATGTDLDVNQRGELWIRGPQVMRGYLNNPQATARHDHRGRLAEDRRHRLRGRRRLLLRRSTA
jgi:acyl-CoA synthetase (AMP-forming)/AMP-acid ligase II